MPSWKIPVLAAALLVSAASADTVLAPSDFNAASFDGMISCVKATNKAFDVAIDDGTTIIVPKDTFDLDNADKAILDCSDKWSTSLDVAIDASRDNVDGLPIVDSAQATSAWAEENGAQGISLEDGDNDDLEKRAGSLAARYAKSFHIEKSKDNDKCKKGEHGTEPYGRCYSGPTEYKSVKFGNLDDKLRMQVKFYPTELCPGYRGLRIVTIPAKHSKCVKGPVKSYGPYYIDKNGKAIN